METMDPRLARVFGEFEAREQRERELASQLDSAEFDQRIDEFLLWVGPEVGRLLKDLIIGVGAKCAVEVGSSFGYSTLWLGWAVRETGGRVYSLEKHAGKQHSARQAIERAGLSDVVEFVPGDALETIETLPPVVDFALIDLWKPLYVPAFDALYAKLESNAIIVADNMIYPAPDDAKRYRDHLAQFEDIESVMLPMGDGIYVSRKR